MVGRGIVRAGGMSRWLYHRLVANVKFLFSLVETNLSMDKGLDTRSPLSQKLHFHYSPNEEYLMPVEPYNIRGSEQLVARLDGHTSRRRPLLTHPNIE